MMWLSFFACTAKKIAVLNMRNKGFLFDNKALKCYINNIT